MTWIPPGRRSAPPLIEHGAWDDRYNVATNSNNTVPLLKRYSNLVNMLKAITRKDRILAACLKGQDPSIVMWIVKVYTNRAFDNRDGSFDIPSKAYV